MRHHYWTTPIALYLFLGGLGGGIMFLTAVFSFFVMPGLLVPEALPYVGEAFAMPMFIAIAALGVGCFFLVFELGQPPVFWRVFTTATAIIKWGAVLLSIALILGFIWFVSYLPWEWIAPLANALAPARDFCLAIAGFCGLCIMLYTGIMLSTLKAHSFWATPALPVLFTVSALSTGCAAIALAIGMWPATSGFESFGGVAVIGIAGVSHELLHIIDIVLVIAEIIVLLVMVLSFLGAGNKTAQAVARRWVKGSVAPIFWVGMVGFGLVIPLLCYIGGDVAASVIAPVLVLCGGLLLRFLIVWADDRAEIPGENRYYNKLPKGNEEFLTKWKYGENLF